MKTLASLFFLMIGCMGLSLLYAQPGNDEIALNLLRNAVESEPGIGEIQSFFSLPGAENISMSDSGNAVISLSPPVISYLKRHDNLFDRKVEMAATIANGAHATREILTYQDSITYRQMRRLIRTSAKPFRGEDPTFRAKWIFPAAAILGGTGITFALFYLRSQ